MTRDEGGCPTAGEAKPRNGIEGREATKARSGEQVNGAPDGGGEQAGGGIAGREESNMRLGAEVSSGATPGPGRAETTMPQPGHDPQTTGYVENPPDAMLESGSMNVLDTRDVPHPQNDVGHTIPETQFSPHKESNGAAYLAVLASIGLDSPVASQGEQGVDDQNVHGQDGDSHLSKSPMSNNVGNAMALGIPRLPPLLGRMWENNNKSPLGKK